MPFISGICTRDPNDIYDLPDDRAALDQAVLEEIHRGSMLASWDLLESN
jgi:hypothetical protein